MTEPREFTDITNKAEALLAAAEDEACKGRCDHTNCGGPSTDALADLAPDTLAVAIQQAEANDALVKIEPYWEKDVNGVSYRCWFCLEAYDKPHDPECAWDMAHTALAAWADLEGKMP